MMLRRRLHLRLDWRLRRLGPGRNADLDRINPDGLANILELGLTEIVDFNIELRLDLPIGVLGKTDRAGLSDPFEFERRY